MNALKHGERTAERMAARTEMGQLIQMLRIEGRYENAAESITEIGLTAVWVGRIANEIAQIDAFSF